MLHKLIQFMREKRIQGVTFLMLALPVIAHADGLDKVNTFMQNIQSILNGASIVSVTVAIMWAGYKFLFTQSDFMHVGKIVIAGLLIGGAGQFASYLIT
ncbi:TrbC/VirB2 family protein [Dongshaea marina]|uniref:TrbC/VirB2 family protein n=1 Tax=Dongshaea marina TaxID=2047966 RepID=UPI001F43C23F|nr:TrbC/VirB2 family protein [Dongshaea marina]